MRSGTGRPSRHWRSLFTVLSGNAVFMASQWTVLVLLVRYAGSAVAGEYVLATTIATPLFLLGSLKLRPAFVADHHARRRFRTYRDVRRATTVCAAAGSLAFGFVWMGLRSWWMLVAVVVAKSAEALSDLHYAVMQLNQQFGALGRSLAARGLIGVVAMGAALTAGTQPSIAVGAWSASWWIVLSLGDRRWTLDGSGRTDGASRRLGRRLLPLGLAAFAVSLSTSVPRLAVEHYLGLGQLGVFGAILMAFTAALFALEVSTDVLLGPLVAAHARRDVRFLQRILRVAIVTGAVVALLGVFASTTIGGELMVTLYGEALEGTEGVLAVLSAATGLHVVVAVMRTGVLAAGGFRERLATELTALSTATAAALLLVPRHGILGAAWAVALATLVQACLSIWQARRLLLSSETPPRDGVTSRHSVWS